MARAAGGPEAQAAIAQAGLFAHVRRAAGVVPTQIAGDLPGGAAAAGRELAVAVNGRIEAVGRSFHLNDGGRALRPQRARGVRCARAATASSCSRWSEPSGCACSPEAEQRHLPSPECASRSSCCWWRRLPPWRRWASPWARTTPGRRRATRRPPVVVVVFDEFPADTLLKPGRRDRRRALSQLRRAGPDLDLVPQRPDGLRLDLQGGAGDPRRAPAAAAHGAGRAQPPAQRLPPDGPPRLRGDQGRVGLGGVPALDLPRRPHAAARRAAAAGRQRAPGAAAPLDRGDPRA